MGSSGCEPIDKVMLQPLEHKGKLTRPRLVLLVHELFGPVSDEAIDVSAAIEFIHTASLVHDDIVDEADLRRGSLSSNCRFGSKTAVLIGDHLFASAFWLLTYCQRYDVLKEVTDTIRSMCQGEISQDLNLYNPYISEEDYYFNIYGKTVSLFKAACQSGALTAGAPREEVYRIGMFGDYLGYAYQIRDDIIDFVGQEKLMGKPVGSDLRNGVITLPIIRALEVSEHGEELRDLIVSREIQNDHINRAITIIGRCGAFDYAWEQALESFDRAKKIVESFPCSQGREALLEFCSEIFSVPPSPWRDGSSPGQQIWGGDISCPSPDFPGFITTWSE